MKHSIPLQVYAYDFKMTKHLPFQTLELTTVDDLKMSLLLNTVMNLVLGITSQLLEPVFAPRQRRQKLDSATRSEFFIAGVWVAK